MIFSLFTFTVMTTGLDVMSFVVPVTKIELWFVLKPSTGLVIESWGGVVSTVKVEETASAAFPSKSETVIDIVCAPSLRAISGVYLMSLNQNCQILKMSQIIRVKLVILE